ncbi:protein containing DUF167 [Candidatus Omnitrophus magneticus]|uniref:UPF0235 protein OMAG_001070 n=1 Tax=Candidatus Omnitrophus magneticus TaxID=1609969 RepID=A0A0F0CU90_9BACT|nr:protein containing DUF167 [Candidatus Omnitrophus magneticus]
MRIEIKVIPKSSRVLVSEENGILKVYVRDAPDKGKANKSVIELIAEKYNVSKNKVKIIRGETSRNKILEIEL